MAPYWKSSASNQPPVTIRRGFDVDADRGNTFLSASSAGHNPGGPSFRSTGVSRILIAILIVGVFYRPLHVQVKLMATVGGAITQPAAATLGRLIVLAIGKAGIKTPKKGISPLTGNAPNLCQP